MSRKFVKRLGAGVCFVGVAENAGPAKVANVIDDFGGTRPRVGEISAMEHQIGRCLAEVGEHCIESGSIAVYIGDDCNAHMLADMDHAWTVNATEFKAKCLQLLTEIEKSGNVITIIRRGRPVAVLSPARGNVCKSPADTWTGKMKIAGDIVNTDCSALWDALRPQRKARR